MFPDIEQLIVGVVLVGSRHAFDPRVRPFGEEIQEEQRAQGLPRAYFFGAGMREGVREADQPVSFDKDVEEVEHPIPLTDPLLELGEAGWFRLCGQALDGEEATLVIGGGFRQMHMGVLG